MDEDPGPSAAYYAGFASTSTGPIRPQSPPRSPLLGPSGNEPEDEESEESLYAILNVSRDASDSEIRDKYRALATKFHPDRQRNEAAKQAAHGRFQEIQRAYEVLSDTAKRTIYDLFGEEGLKTSWEVGPRNMTPEELKKEYQRQAFDMRRMEAEALVKPKGDLSVMWDARAVFIPASMFQRPDKVKHDPWSRLMRVRQGRVTLKHSFEMPLSERTQLVWTGQGAASGGRGGANVLGTIRHQFSPKLWVETGASLLQPQVLTGKATYTHDENT